VDAFKFNIKFDIFVRYLIFLIQLVRLLTGFYYLITCLSHLNLKLIKNNFGLKKNLPFSKVNIYYRKAFLKLPGKTFSGTSARNGRRIQ
jgi:hypothetical protein